MSYRFLVSILLVVSACSSSQIDIVAEREALLAVMAQERRFHLEKRVEDFVGLISLDHISVNRGAIARPTREELQSRFDAYFDRVDFEKWDDLTPPVIRFSDDYSLAYAVFHKEVVVTTTAENGDPIRTRTEFSWLAVYRRTNEGWKIESVASTNLPTEIEPISD